MKKVFIILLIIPFLTAFTLTKTKEDFIGKWTGEDKGDIGSIIFDKEGYATFMMGDQVFGGKEFIMSGKKGNMTYSINTETTPIQIDFVVEKIESGEEKRLLGIVKFINDNSIKLALSFNSAEGRPKSFDESIILNRVD